MNVVVVGAGFMGTVHAEWYTEMQDVNLLGIVDASAERAESLAKRFGARASLDLGAVLESSRVDIVDVCVPTYLHKDYILQAAAAKAHVIAEKPLALTAQDAKVCIDACEAAGVRLFVGQVVRFFPEYKQIRELVAAGGVGQVGTARALRGGSFPQGWNNWYKDPEKSGSMIVDLMIHDFDFLRWCFGEVERVYAKSLGGGQLSGMDHALVSLRFKSGVIAHVEGTWAQPAGFATEIEIAGSLGMVQHKSSESITVQLQKREADKQSAGVEIPSSPLERSPYYLELAHFLDCIRGKAEPLVTPDDALRALEIGLAAATSARTGGVVELSGPIEGGMSV